VWPIRDEQGTRKTKKGTLHNCCSFLQLLARHKQKLRPNAKDTLVPLSKKLPSQNMHWPKAELPELKCKVLSRPSLIMGHRTICLRKKMLLSLAAIFERLLVVCLLAGGIAIDNGSADEPARTAVEKATTEQPWQNSLGMKFIPVTGTQVLFDIWDTRVEDFRAFVDSASYEVTGDMWSLGKDGWKQRGASWDSRNPIFLRSSSRDYITPDYHGSFVGFRCVLARETVP
jgi:hypothetical protein